MFIEPKSLELRKLVEICSMLTVQANLNPGETPVKSPRAIKDFYDPHGEEVPEEQLQVIVEAHVREHGWKLKPVYIILAFREWNKRLEPQLPYINERLAFVTSGKAEPWNPEFR